MAHRKVTAGLAACLVAGVLVGCGDEYEHGAGVFTSSSPASPTATVTTPTPTTTTTTPAPRPLQSTDSSGTESSEAPPLTPARKRDVTAAAAATRTFLHGYLPYSYGKAQAGQIRAVDAPLRAQLAARPPRVPPALAAKARPRLTHLTVSGANPSVVYLLAQVDDTASKYVVFLEVRHRKDGWQVARVQ